MPSKQTSSATSRKPAQSARSSAAARGRGASGTGERDEHYDLISVLYHALQGADTCGQYLEDARRVGDRDLVSFFEETRAEQAERAATAKQLLVSRLELDAESEELEEEDEEDELEEEDEDED